MVSHKRAAPGTDNEACGKRDPNHGNEHAIGGRLLSQLILILFFFIPSHFLFLSHSFFILVHMHLVLLMFTSQSFQLF